MRSPQYYRARIELFRHQQSISSKTDKEALIRSGVYAPAQEEEDEIKALLDKNQYPDTPLSFTELCTYNTWFQIHPDKVCGKEVITSSRDFPLSIKGDRETVETTIRKFLKPSDVASLELDALALELELQLLTL
jgi:hypothetical protein